MTLVALPAGEADSTSQMVTCVEQVGAKRRTTGLSLQGCPCTSHMGIKEVQSEAQSESSQRSCSRFFPSQKTKVLFRCLRAPRLNISPSVCTLNDFSTSNFVASHLDEAVVGTLGLGKLLGLFEGHDINRLVHVIIHARVKGDVGVDAATQGELLS